MSKGSLISRNRHKCGLVSLPLHWRFLTLCVSDPTFILLLCPPTGFPIHLKRCQCCVFLCWSRASQKLPSRVAGEIRCTVLGVSHKYNGWDGWEQFGQSGHWMVIVTLGFYFTHWLILYSLLRFAVISSVRLLILLLPSGCGDEIHVLCEREDFLLCAEHSICSTHTAEVIVGQAAPDFRTYLFINFNDFTVISSNECTD